MTSNYSFINIIREYTKKAEFPELLSNQLTSVNIRKGFDTLARQHIRIQDPDEDDAGNVRDMNHGAQIETGVDVQKEMAARKRKWCRKLLGLIEDIWRSSGGIPDHELDFPKEV